MRSRTLLGVTCLLAFVGVAGLAIPALVAGPAVASSAAARVDAAIRRKRPKKTRFAVGVWDASTGALITRQNAERVLRPASVMKLATTGAALLRLGPEDAFTTDVYVDWRKAGNGRKATRLKVVGTGDPGLSGRFHDGDVEAPLRDLARQVAAAGVTRVDGDLVLDVSAFEGPDRHHSWGWKPGAYEWWRAPVTALIVNDNCLDITALPGPKVGAPGRLTIAPACEAITFLNELTTVAKRSQHSIRFLPPVKGSGAISVRGGVLIRSAGYSKPLALADPELVFASVFRRLLRAEGVQVTGDTEVLTSERRTVPGGPYGRISRVRIARHTTSVLRAVNVANTRSQNLFAEVLLRRLGQELGKGGSFADGAEVVRKTFGFKKQDPAFHQVDGSGLSRENQATVAAIGRILLRLFDSPRRIQFMESLAVGGEAGGTLRKRFRGERFAGRVRAKTGTLNDTSALAGYVRSHDGRVYAFVVLGEGLVHEARTLQDAVVEALVSR